MKTKYKYDDFLSAAKNSDNKKNIFIRKYRRLYEYSRNVGWYEKYEWNKDHTDFISKIYSVYCYQDQDNKTVYVGLTKNVNKRFSQHKCKGTVYEYFKDKCFPDPIILLNNLNATEAKVFEQKYVEDFIKKGWRVLNKKKTGIRSSSLGSCNELWTYEKCFEESRKYKTKTEFQKKNVSAYRRALENGWIDLWFDNAYIKWDENTCFAEAMKYTSLSDYRKYNQSAYNSSLKNGWLKYYTWFKKKSRSIWNDEYKCYQAAKQCSSKTEFSKKFSSAYKQSHKNGWINKYDWFKKTSELLSDKKKKWTYESCKKLSMKYKTRWEFGKENSRAYHVCLKNKWLESFTWLKGRKDRSN